MELAVALPEADAPLLLSLPSLLSPLPLSSAPGVSEVMSMGSDWPSNAVTCAGHEMKEDGVRCHTHRCDAHHWLSCSAYSAHSRSFSPAR